MPAVAVEAVQRFDLGAPQASLRINRGRGIDGVGQVRLFLEMAGRNDRLTVAYC
jgi:hypothetical protein